ncbi:MAG: Zn-dependent oxidoreductase, NADPH:quinone reductase, partial [Marmoricola sp.]|nr:Zn-dependent oxidoreductase, NADPH:quinone reductase [Marmoricola sp.]
WMALTWRARLQPGERVLVLGGGGAVGQTAIGAARLLGAGQVVAACRSRDAADRAAAAGADEVVVLGEQPDLVAQLLASCAGEVDVVVDPVFGAIAEAAVHVLAPGGRLVNLGSAAGEEATFSSALVRSRSLEVLGYTNNALSVEQRRAAVVAIAGHAAAGRLGVAREVRSLEDIAQVWGRQASGDSAVRFVLRPGRHTSSSS